MTTLKCKKFEYGFIVSFDSHAEMFAFCLCAEMTVDVDKGEVVLSREMFVDDTPLLKQAINTAYNNMDGYAVCFDSGYIEIVNQVVMTTT